MEKNNYLLVKVLVVILCIGALVYGGYTYYKNKVEEPVIDNPVEEDTGVIKSKYATEEFYLDRLSKDGYGFAKIYFDDHIDLVQLMPSGDNNVIMSFKEDEENKIWNEPFHLMTINNNFYFEIVYAESVDGEIGWQNKNHRLYKINLDTMEISMVYDSKTFELLYDDYTVSDKYVYKAREDVDYKPEYNLIKYNPDTDEKVVLNDKLEVDDLFIYDSKLFLKCSNKSYKELEIANSNKITKDEYNYFSMDEDGNNLTAYTKEEYTEYKKKSGLSREKFSSDNGSYFMNDGKKITISNNKLMYDNKVIYTPKKGYVIELYYTNEKGYAAIYSVKPYQNGATDDGYYMVNINTKEVKKVAEQDIYDYVRVYYK